MGLAGGNYRPPRPDVIEPPYSDVGRVPERDPMLIGRTHPANGGFSPEFYRRLNPGKACPRAPDFVNFQIDAYVFSVWGTFSRDGNSFFGGGMNRSFVNPLNLSASASAGWLNKSGVAPGDTNNFVGGYGGTAAAAYAGVG
jgi:hypothetical protein